MAAYTLETKLKICFYAHDFTPSRLRLSVHLVTLEIDFLEKHFKALGSTFIAKSAVSCYCIVRF